MPPRFYIADQRLAQAPREWALPAGAARHAQVLRLQPGDALTLFDGHGGEWSATVAAMGRSEVRITLGAHSAVSRELPCAVTLAVGMPANDRMDMLVEKATELGVALVQPLVCARSVLRLHGERAAKKVAHWQAVACAAAEQSARTRVPMVAPIRPLSDWLASAEPADARWLLDPRAAQRFMPAAQAARMQLLSGPEGGLDDAEQASARSAGFVPVNLGARVLRADTAPLAALAAFALGLA